MVGFLKQSTASQSRMVGPFVDDTDFKTAETGLSIANTDVKLSKNGGGTTKNSGGGTHIANGMYALTFDATDTDEVGELGFSISVSGALIVVGKFVVLEEAIYDSLFAPSATGFDANQRVNVGSWLGTAVTTSDIAIRTTLAKTTHITGFNDLSTAQINTEADTALSDYDPPTRAELTTDVNSILSKLLKYVQLIVRSDAAIATDNATELTAVNANGGSGAGSFDNTTEATQALRDRGDSAWVTGGGGSISDILNIQPLMPYGSIDLANTSDYRMGLMLINSLDDLPSTAEITPGTISIDRKAIGGTSWTAVVTDAACSEIAGLIYYDEVFDSGTGYAEGDSIRVTFKNQKITVAANDYEIVGSTGRMFYTEIRQTMRGTNGANTTTPPTAAAILAEIDANSTQLALILQDTSELQEADIIAALGELNDLNTQEVRDAMQLAPSGSSAAGSIDEFLELILEDTAELQAIDIASAFGELNDLSAAQVNAEILDVLTTDTFAEPGQGTPASTTSLALMIRYLYKSWRNKKDNDGTVTNLYDSSGSTIDHKQTTGESGGVVTKGDWTTGP